MMPSIQPLFDALYCEEDHWNITELTQPSRNFCLDLSEGVGDSSSDRETSLDLLGQDLFLEDEELSFLLNKELENGVWSGFEESPAGFGEDRAEAVEWMLRVVEYYSFSALTSVLAVNYLDRFLRGLPCCHRDKPWMTQLAAVACLSLAAKVEETHVPLLLDLQVEESKYLFESKTIQRTEMLILSALKWRMNPVTPLSYLHHIARRLGLKGHICQEFVRRCECLLLCVVYDSRFMCHLPSALATAVMLHVMNRLEPSVGVENQDQLLGILGINKDKVKDCCRLIQEVATNAHFHSSNKRKFGSLPGSPKGVMDMTFSFSTDSSSSNDSWTVNSSSGSSASSSPERSSKKIKSWTTDNDNANLP